VFSVLTNPILKAYEKGNALQDVNSSKYGIYSLGNLGYSSVQCASVPLSMGEVVLQCPYGKIHDIVTNGFGINTPDLPFRDACLVDNDKFKNNECSSQIEAQAINSFF